MASEPLLHSLEDAVLLLLPLNEVPEEAAILLEVSFPVSGDGAYVVVTLLVACFAHSYPGKMRFS